MFFEICAFDFKIEMLPLFDDYSGNKEGFFRFPKSRKISMFEYEQYFFHQSLFEVPKFFEFNLPEIFIIIY